MEEFDSDHAFDIYQKVCCNVDKAVTEFLNDEIEEVREYVITRLSEEYRFWFIYS